MDGTQLVETNSDLFLSIAEIAGILIGFGALIAFTGASSAGRAVPTQVNSLVGIGVTVLTAALLPVGLGEFGLVSDNVWQVSSAAFLLLIWGVMLVALRDAPSREWFRELKNDSSASLMFWVVLEVPTQVSLVVATLGLYPEFGRAFYTLALIINLLQAAFLLMRLLTSAVEKVDQ